MAKIRSFILIGLCLTAFGATASERFLSAITDLPLMAGLTEAPGSAVVFSKPAGRIVEVAARGAVTRAAVLGFYRRTLPQLGWRRAGAFAFVRERERLALGFSRVGGRLVVQFSLAPK